MVWRQSGEIKSGGSFLMSEDVKKLKSNYRRKQENTSVEERIRQLYAMQQRYLAISREAIKSGLKKPSEEFTRACRLLGQ